MNLREAAQQALEALESDHPDIQLRAAIALRAALAEPQTTHWEGCEAVHPECRKSEPPCKTGASCTNKCPRCAEPEQEPDGLGRGVFAAAEPPGREHEQNRMAQRPAAFDMSEELVPWCYGAAECLACHHEWVAVWPLGAESLGCPACGSTDTDREQADPHKGKESRHE